MKTDACLCGPDSCLTRPQVTQEGQSQGRGQRQVKNNGGKDTKQSRGIEEERVKTGKSRQEVEKVAFRGRRKATEYKDGKEIKAK